MNGSRRTLPTEPEQPQLCITGDCSVHVKISKSEDSYLGCGTIFHVTSSDVRESKIFVFPQGSPPKQNWGGRLTHSYLSQNCTHSKPINSPCHPLPDPTKPPHLPVQRSEGCGISRDDGEAIKNGFWILDERAYNNCTSLSEGNTEKQDHIWPSFPDSMILHKSLPSTCEDISFTEWILIVLILLQKCGDAMHIKKHLCGTLRTQEVYTAKYLQLKDTSGQLSPRIFCFIISKYYFPSKQQ